MGASSANLSWLWMFVGVALGVGGTVGAVFYLGRKIARHMRLEDRGDWDRPLAKPFPPDYVVAVYRRRKRYHQHDRHYYQRRPSGTAK